MELLACPFCGEHKQEVEYLDDENYVVRCGWCGAMAEKCAKKEDAVESWNTRRKPINRWVEVT